MKNAQFIFKTKRFSHKQKIASLYLKEVSWIFCRTKTKTKVITKCESSEIIPLHEHLTKDYGAKTIEKSLYNNNNQQQTCRNFLRM